MIKKITLILSVLLLSLMLTSCSIEDVLESFTTADVSGKTYVFDEIRIDFKEGYENKENAIRDTVVNMLDVREVVFDDEYCQVIGHSGHSYGHYDYEVSLNTVIIYANTELTFKASKEGLVIDYFQVSKFFEDYTNSIEVIFVEK